MNDTNDSNKISHNDIKKNILNSVLGNALLITCPITQKTFNDPVLAAIVGFFPLGLLCCFVMPTRPALTKYMHNGCYVILLTLLVILGGYLLVKQYNYPITILVLTIFVWFFVQYIYYINKEKLGVN